MNKTLELIKDIVSANNFVSGAIAIGIVLSIALGCNCGKNLDLANLAKNSNSTASNSSTTSDAVPSNPVVEGLVKDTMRKFRGAIRTKDFTELYNDASTDFQGTYTLAQVESAFKAYTNKKGVVVPILDKIESTDAEFDRQPSIRTEKNLNILVASGKFKTKPYNVRFDYEYVMRGGEWKLLKLIINIP
ncbi:MAG: hypothetical protein ABL952_14645 [Pyrinomonadaceae bacterium]